MGRRRLVVLVSALAMLLLGTGLVGALVAATQSEGGREWIRRQLARQLASGVRGTLHLGRLSGSFLTDLGIDSLSIRDPDDSVFLAFGPMHFTYDPRDLLDGRIIVRSAELQRPFAVFRKDDDDRWNYRKVFPAGPKRPGGPPPARRAFGALVVFRDVRLRGGALQLTLPWAPDDSLHGARRDSAIAVNLGDRRREIRRVVTNGRPGFQRTLRWTDLDLALTRFRFRHPDSVGRRFDIARMDVTVRDPPFALRDVRGGALWRGDSVWVDFAHFALPGSTGRASGRLDWADRRPIRWDIRIRSDSVALADIAWIHETLPRTGQGAMDLHILSERDPHVMDYIITNMDARSTGSRLRGAMTFGVGAPVLIVKDVDLALEPVDFALLETLNGAKFPFPWRGTLTGTVRGRGGPVNRFALDEAALTFTDRNVSGATASGVATGEVDILFPGRAKFHGVRLALERFDLRTAQFLNEDFPRLNGVLSGVMTLDSVWTDVRLSAADLTHRDGDAAPPSRLKGGGRVTLGGESIRFDVALAALPLSASAVARSFPRFPLRGEYSGPLRVRGTVSDLAVSGDLVGEAGRVQLDGQFDVFPPGFRAVARGSLSGLDLRRALGRPGAPESVINGRFAVALEGDSLANLSGTLNLTADRSVVDSVRVYAAHVEARFTDGVVRVDTARVESVPGLFTASGGLGLTAARADSLAFRAVVDSLGGLRRFLARGRATLERVTGADSAVRAVADSLDGTLVVTGWLTGSLDRFGVRAAVIGSELRLAAAAARTLGATVRLDALPDSTTGLVTLRLDTLGAGGVALARVRARAEFERGAHVRAAAEGESPSGARVGVSARIERRDDTTVVRLDTLAVRTTGGAWSLARRATLTVAEGGFAVDSVILSTARGARLVLAGRVPREAGLGFGLVADRVPLADVGELLQTKTPLTGDVSLTADVRGTRARPDVTLSGALRDATVAGLALEALTLGGRYANRRLTASLDYSRKGVHALHADATLPVDLAFRPAGPRLLEEPLSGRVRTDSVGLALFEAIAKVTGASGALAFDADLAGTWRHPRVTGALRASDGALSLAPIGEVKLSGLEADLAFLGDSIAVRRLSVKSDAGRGALTVDSGYVTIRDIENPRFVLPLRAQNFNVIRRAGFADLDVTGSVRLAGAYRAAVLTGGLTVDRGTITVPELYQKRVISLDDPELYRIVDTSAFVERRLLPEPPPAFMESLTVLSMPIQMGRDVWLRSEEANINLGGLVSVTRGRVQRGRKAGQVQLALEGTLETVRGTYRLNLGPVQRTFQVENGDVRFYGDPDLNATLMNINALHTVRQFTQRQGGRPDVRVRVHLGGTLLAPTAELSSPDSLRVTNADLISYLVTGGPSYAIGARGGDAGSAAANVLLSSFGSVLGGKASGGLCDEARLSTSGLEAYQGRLREVSANILSGTRFNCAKRLSEKAFVRADFGLCQVGQLVGAGNATSDPLSWADAIGVKLDYRLQNDFTLSGGMDPSTSAVLCTRDANARGFAPTPRQFGFDFFRFWRF